MSLTSSTVQKEEALLHTRLSLLFNHSDTDSQASLSSRYQIITNPHAIWEVLSLLDHTTTDRQLLLLDELLIFFQKVPLNSLIIVNKTSQQLPDNTTISVIDKLIMISLRAVGSHPEVSYKILEVLSTLYQFNSLQKNHLNIVYSFLSQQFYDHHLNNDSIMFAIKLLHQTISLQTPKINEPATFFYFTGQGCGLQAAQTSQMSWSFNNGFAVGIWFYLDEHSEHTGEEIGIASSTGRSNTKLFSIHAQEHGGIEAYFVGRRLHYRVLSEHYSEPNNAEQSVFVGEFQPNRWYYMGLEHERSKGTGRACLKTVINDESREVVEMGFPQIDSSAMITKLKFGENFQGRISTAILFKSPVGQTKLMEIYSLFNFGIHNENILKGVHGSIEKFLDKIMLMYTPLRSADKTCYDIFNGLHGSLLKNSGLCEKDSTKVRVGALGGVASLLPLFYILRHLKTKNHSNILDELWKLLLVLFKNFPETQFEASKLSFFRVIGQLLAETEDDLFSSASIELLAELRNCLSHARLSEEMFIDIFWNVDIFKHTEEHIRNQVWVYLRTIYLQNPSYYVSLYDISDILDLTINKFDAPFQAKTIENDKADWCCGETKEFKQAEKVLGPLISKEVDIIETILITGCEPALEGILSVVNIFGLRCSSYLHLLLLRMLKNVLVDRRDDALFTSKAYIKALLDYKTPQYILYLMTSTHCLDLKAMCIKILNVLLTHPLNKNNKPDVTHYISNVICPTTNVQKDQEMDFDKLFAKTEPPTQELARSPDFLAITKPPNKKGSKLTLPNFGDEPTSLSRSAAASSLQNALNNDLMYTTNDKKLAEMSLNLRSSMPKERSSESESFRKNKTFDFNRGTNLPHDFGGGGGLKGFELTSNLGQLADPSGSSQSGELVLETPPIGLKKKMQASSSSSRQAKMKFPLEIQTDSSNSEEGTTMQTKAVDVEVKKPQEQAGKQEEGKGTGEPVLLKTFPRAGDLKRKKKELAIVSEQDNDDQSMGMEAIKGVEIVLQASQQEGNKSEKMEEEKKKEVEDVEKEKEVEVKETVKAPVEPEVRPKGKGRGLGMGKKPPVGLPLELDIQAINEEFTFGGEKGQKMMEEGDLEKVMDKVLNEVYKMARDCVEYMKNREKDAEKSKEIVIVPEEGGFREPKNMPQSVRGLKKIEFTGSRALKPTLEPEKQDFVLPVSSSGRKDLNFLKTTNLKSQLDVVKEKSFALSDRSDEFNLSSSLDQASPEQNQPIIFRTTPKGQSKFQVQALEGKGVTEESSRELGYEWIYNSLIEWLLHKQPTCVTGAVAIDDTDKINFVEVLPVIMHFFKQANELMKQKMMQDVYVLVKWNPTNCALVLQMQEFHQFLLDTLYDYQILLYSAELKGVPMLIWELATKTHTVLLRHALLQDPEGSKHLQNLFIWLQNKRIVALNKPNPTKYEKGAQYLLRHLWLNLLEGLVDIAVNTKPSLDSHFWKNIQQVAFYTQEIITSTFNHGDPHTTTTEPKISTLGDLITRLHPGEDFPYNFKAIFAQSYWVDWKLCETFLKVLEPIWALTKQQETLEKLKENSGQEDTSKVLRLLLGESSANNTQGRGCLLKVVSELISCYLEDTIENGVSKGVDFACDKIERLLRALFIAGEGSRNTELVNSHRDFLTCVVLYSLRFFYQMAEKTNEAHHKNPYSIVKKCIVNVVNYIREQNTAKGQMAETVVEYLNIREDLEETDGREDVERLAFEGEVKDRLLIDERVERLIRQYYEKPPGGNEMSKNLEEKALVQSREMTGQEKAREEVKEKNRREILELVGEVCELENQRRKKAIMGHEEYRRIGKASWKKIWKRLRVYVGQWRHPKFYDQDDVKDIKEPSRERNTLLVHKICKYEVKSRARPFLKVKLIDPSYSEEHERKLKEKREEERNDALKVSEGICAVRSSGEQEECKIVNMKEETGGSPQIPKGTGRSYSAGGGPKAMSYWSNVTGGFHCNVSFSHGQGSPVKVETHLSNRPYAMSPSPKLETTQKEETFLSKKCQWIKPLSVRNGWLHITSHRLIFTLENAKETSFTFPDPEESLDERRATKDWPLDFIKEIQKKKYHLKKTALEIYMIDGSTLLFNFSDSDLEDISQKLVRMRKTRCPNLIYYGSLDSRKIIDKANITKKWLNYEMTNFEYLMWLNSLSGRSYNDLTQYPVFPWILDDYSSSNLDLGDLRIYRDLSQLEVHHQRILSAASPANNFCCSPEAILQFLQRLRPYLNNAVAHCEKGNNNKPTFTSIQDIYKKTAEELIPEFFFLPDLLNKPETTEKSGNEGLGCVELPKWCGGSPYRFVMTIRKALESDAVSGTLHAWIDLVFGYKQAKKEAATNISNKHDFEESASTSQFGQAPCQLFNKAHPQRGPSAEIFQAYKLVVDPGADVRVYRPPSKKKVKEGTEAIEESTGVVGNIEKLGSNALIKMKVINDARLIGLRRDGRITYFKWWSAGANQDGTAAPFKCGIEKEKLARLNKGKHDWCDQLDYSINYVSYPAVFLNMGKIIAAGGYWDGRLSLFSTDNDNLIEAYFYHNDTITAIANDHKENFLITGSKSGECIVWKISPELTKLTAKFHFYDHSAMINHIFISNELRLFATASADGKINIYHFIIGQLFRTIHHPANFPIQTVVLSSCPLPCVVFSSEKDQSLYSYSINGKLLEHIPTNSLHVTSPILVKDHYCMESLAYGTEKGELYLRKLPFLEYVKKWDVSLNCSVLNVLVSKDKRYMFCGCSDGEFSVLTDPSSSSLQSQPKPDNESHAKVSSS